MQADGERKSGDGLFYMLKVVGQYESRSSKNVARMGRRVGGRVVHTSGEDSKGSK